MNHDRSHNPTNNDDNDTGNNSNDKKKGSVDDSNQMTFAQTEEWHKNAKCHNCGKKGHIRPNCPDLDKNKKATTNANVDSNDKNEKDEDSGKKVTFDKNTKKGSTNVNVGKADDDTCDNCGGFSFLNHTVLPRVPEVWKDSRSVACFMEGDNNIEKMTKWMLLDNQSTVDIFCDSRCACSRRNDDYRNKWRNFSVCQTRFSKRLWMGMVSPGCCY